MWGGVVAYRQRQQHAWILHKFCAADKITSGAKIRNCMVIGRNYQYTVILDVFEHGYNVFVHCATSIPKRRGNVLDPGYYATLTRTGLFNVQSQTLGLC